MRARKKRDNTNFVGIAELSEATIGIRMLADIGVMLQREFPVSGLELRGRGFLVHTEKVIELGMRSSSSSRRRDGHSNSDAQHRHRHRLLFPSSSSSALPSASSSSSVSVSSTS